MLRSFPALAALTVISLAWAQLAWAQDVPTTPEILPMPSEAPPVPAAVEITPGQPAPSVSQKPVALPGVSGTLNVARTVSGAVPLTITVRAGDTPLVIGVRRDNTQNCAYGPLVRVVRVGTQEVVYPAAGSQKRLCTQEVVTKSTAASGAASFSRELKVPPGEYMVESWLTGLVNGVLVKVPATPVRITVK
ncbi:hypothetical protein [Deinococcus sp.]|uniref:hypothetical protein n=1 Tax=Deinococcus sp. TaxID=47478 RepID=UPI0028698BBD|nr:hypothetical protein [Deinococcus sp.]